MNNTVNFCNAIHKKSIIPTFISTTLLFFYAIFFISMSFKEVKWAIFIEFFVLVLTILIFIPLENYLLINKTGSLIESWKTAEETTLEFRTQLFIKLAKFPLRRGILIFLTFLSSSTVSILCFLFVPFIHISVRLAFMASVACIFGSYMAAILAISYTETICSMHCEELVIQGIDKELVENKKHFGLRITLRCILYLLVPLVFIFLTMYFDLQLKNGNSLEQNLNLQMQLIRIVIINILNVVIYTNLCFIFYKKIKNTSDTLANAIEEIIEVGNTSLYIRTNIFDSMQYSIFVLNEIIENYAKVINKSQNIGQEVLNTTENLSSIAQNLESTSTEQNSDVQEITATMEETNISLRNIDSKLVNISNAIDSSNKEVSVGFNIMKQNIEQMNKIENSNNSILNGIKNLTEHISMIENIINIINDIAEQTRIIAFNAELEAVSAGTKGKNFHIIASEIRRLANNIMESIVDIRTHTLDIQKASQILTEVSNSTTNFIREEHDIAQELESHFHNIQDSTKATAAQTAEITSTVSQQKASFEQIVITLNQISSSIRSFTVSTKDISNTATEIRKAALRLNQLH